MAFSIHVPSICLMPLTLVAFVTCGCATSRPSVSEVRRLGQRGATEGLLDAWSDADRDAVRIAVLEGLARNPEDPAGRALVLEQALHASSGPVRLAALRAADAHVGPDVVRVFVEGLAHPWPDVRDLSQSLLLKRAPQSADLLVQTATRHRLSVAREGAVRLLGRVAHGGGELRDRAAAVLLDRAARDSAASVRVVAVEALGSLNVQVARSLLSELARTDPNSRVRLAAGEAAAALTRGGTQDRGPVVVVLPLKNHAIRDAGLSGLGGQVADYLQARLTTARVCHVIDRTKVELALAELRRTGRALYDGDSPNAPELGAFKLANQMVFGSIQRQGSKYTMVLNRMDVSTLQLVPGASATVTGYRADLDRMMAELAERFIARF